MESVLDLILWAQTVNIGYNFIIPQHIVIHTHQKETLETYNQNFLFPMKMDKLGLDCCD